MSYMLQHLTNGWQVDQAILSEEDRIVVSFIIKVMHVTCKILISTLGMFSGYKVWP